MQFEASTANKRKDEGGTKKLSNVCDTSLMENKNEDGGREEGKLNGYRKLAILNEKHLPIQSSAVNEVHGDIISSSQVQLKPNILQKCSKIKPVDNFSTIFSDDEFKKEELENLDGVSSIAVRNMTKRERRLVLYKRRLRNRLSAKRSREKRMKILSELDEQSSKGFEQVLKNIEDAMNLAISNEKLFESVQKMNGKKKIGASD